MVFVWSQIRGLESTPQVSLNDVIMIFAYAPPWRCCSATDLEVPWATLILSVALYIVILLAATSRGCGYPRAGVCHEVVTRFTARVKPLGDRALATVVLFGFQAR
jgi:ACR3 family arsenite transporter